MSRTSCTQKEVRSLGRCTAWGRVGMALLHRSGVVPYRPTSPSSTVNPTTATSSSSLLQEQFSQMTIGGSARHFLVGNIALRKRLSCHLLHCASSTITSTSFSSSSSSCGTGGHPRHLAPFSSLHSLQISQRTFFVSKRKVRCQLSLLKHEADNARKNAREDVEKAKRYGITDFGLDMLEVMDTLQKGVKAFDLHCQRFGVRPPVSTTTNTTSSSTNHSAPLPPSSHSVEEASHPSASTTNIAVGGGHGGGEGGGRGEPGVTRTHCSSHAAEVKSLDAIFTGIQLSMRLLEKQLQKHGIEKIRVQCGDKFDPSVHEAVSSVPPSPPLLIEAESIAAVMKEGYKIKDRVLRPAQVVVVVGG